MCICYGHAKACPLNTVTKVKYLTLSQLCFLNLHNNNIKVITITSILNRSKEHLRHQLFICCLISNCLCLCVCVSACLQGTQVTQWSVVSHVTSNTRVFDTRHLIFLSLSLNTHTHSLVSFTCPEAEPRRLTQMWHRCLVPWWCCHLQVMSLMCKEL